MRAVAIPECLDLPIDLGEYRIRIVELTQAVDFLLDYVFPERDDRASALGGGEVLIRVDDRLGENGVDRLVFEIHRSDDRVPD